MGEIMPNLVFDDETGRAKWLGTTKVGHVVQDHGNTLDGTGIYNTLCGKEIDANKAAERDQRCKSCTKVLDKRSESAEPSEPVSAPVEDLPAEEAQTEKPHTDYSEKVANLRRLLEEAMTSFHHAQMRIETHRTAMESLVSQVGGSHLITNQLRQSTAGVLTRNQMANAKYRVKALAKHVDQLRWELSRAKNEQ